MAAESSTTGAPTTTTEPNESHNRTHRGRGRGGLGGPKRQEQGENGGFRGDRGRGGPFRGRSRGRGRGNRDRIRPHSQSDGTSIGASGEIPLPVVPPPPLASRGTFGGRLTEDAKKTEGEDGTRADGEEDVEAENVPHLLATTEGLVQDEGLRALQEAQTVIFTDDAVKRFEDFNAGDFSSEDPNLGIKYEKPEIYEDTVLLLRYNCPDPSCDVACMGWPDLHRHVKSAHQEVMCDLCTRNKKVFTHEHELFTISELRKHEKYGDDNPGAVDQSGFKGHPECGFCRQRFYGDDELYAHCRDKHERCHLCDRRDSNRAQQYYVNYDALEVHFRKDHFLCLDQECLEKKFVVFDSEMDLKGHQLEAHPNGLSKDARRDARRVDLSAFDFRAPHQPERGGRREGRGRGRGRDPNAEPLPQSSAQPLRRDELAYQRAMAIQTAQSIAPRSFGGQLSAPEPQTVRPSQRAVEASRGARHQQDASDGLPALHALHLRPSAADGPSPRPSSPAQPSVPLTPQEQARHLRHAAVTERAANLLRNDNTKMNDFRNRVSSYRLGALSAPNLIDAFFSLFDTSSAELGKLIKELAEIFEIPTKHDALLKAWADWKAINEDYPSLPGPSGPPPSTAAGVLGAGLGGSRVLKLKSSTAQSSRSAVSRHGSWGSAIDAANSFPAIASRAAGPTSGPKPAKAAPAPSWLASASTSNSARASPAPSRTQSSANLPKAGSDAFPSLPATRKPTSTVFSPGYTGAGVRRPNAPSVPVTAWGAGSTSNGAQSTANDGVEAVDVGKKQSNKGKKQVLFQWG
ncbi:hypothetical protein LTR66_010674 [Elasticomyces elasticus]|nr:hypothetical protein LTR66_010674 [Elasticomyces elasticus]